jgi:hypothetical protein
MEQWQLFFTITGVFFWGYWVLRAIDYIGVIKARRNGGIYVDMKGTKHNFAPLKDWTMEPCDKCKPKKKWERLNAKDDNSERV